METKMKTGESRVKIGEPKLPVGVRSGGENIPLEFPHLYQIQAGDWRISYAVEHNRLAILVLEVLNADGEPIPKDAAREKLNRKMKVKLLDWPEGSGPAQVPPEEITKKLKIKWMDLGDEAGDAGSQSGRSHSRIKLGPASSKATAGAGTSAKGRIILHGASQPAATEEEQPQEGEIVDSAEDDRKITPVDKPSM